MTYRLDPGSPLDAVYDLAKRYPGGVDAVAHRLKAQVATFYKKLSHNVETHRLTLDEFERTLHVFAEANMPDAFQPLHSLAWRFDHVCIPVPHVSSDCPNELSIGVMKIAQEIGDVARETANAAQDGVITKREYERIDREIEEAMSALAAHREALKALAKGAK